MTLGLRHDVAVAARTLLRARGVTAIAILSLAIGIAANATIFSLVQAVEFPRLIYPDASRLVFFESRNDARGLIGMPVSAPDALDIAAASRTLERSSLAADQSSVLRVGSAAWRVAGRRVTNGFFEVMGVPAAAGRTLGAGDREGTIVLGDGLWRTHFGSDAAIVGAAVRLDGGTVTVVGVMPPQFDADADFWVPLTRPGAFARDDRQLTLFARLAPGATVRAASLEAAEISRRLAADHPATNRNWISSPTLLSRMHGRDSRGAFIMLQAAVGFVLLIACANIANILLARGTARRHEMAVRVSLGATRGRLVAILLLESLLLSAAGGAIGVLLSMWGIRLARALGGFPDSIDPTLNPIVLAFTAGLSIVTGVLCGVAPALRASGVAPDAVLRADGARGMPGRTGGRLRGALVIVQIAAALVLSVSAALMVQTLANRQRVDLGFDPDGALQAELALPADRFTTPDAARDAVDRVLERLARSPDVVAAGAITWALPTAAGGLRAFTLPADRDTPLPPAIRRSVEAVTTSYFDALGVAVKAGRAFAPQDRTGSAPVAIVNEELAHQLWRDRNPLGEPLRLGAPAESAPIVTVVGVVGTIRRSAMHDVAVARAYVPYAQHPNANVTFVVRPRGEAAPASRELQSAVQEIDPLLLVERLRTVESDLAQFVAPIRLITLLLGGFGAAGLLLAALGVFGTMSYSVSQREREMAVRAALGADRRAIFRLVYGSALRITTAGLGIGIAASLGSTRALASFLYGVSATDPLTLVLVVAALTAVALGACYRPARRAATSDPMALLRM